MKQKGIIIVISGPSGGGKTTISALLKEYFPSMYHSVSCTTRPRRTSETLGKDYFFVTPEEFRQKILKREFAEWAEVYGNLYGTPKKPLEEKLEQGIDVLMDIDIQGAEKMMKLYPEGLFIFIMPPSIKVLRERLLSRKTETSDSFEKRFIKAEEEMKFSNHYNYTVVNEDLGKTIAKLKAIIEKEKKKRQI